MDIVLMNIVELVKWRAHAVSIPRPDMHREMKTVAEL